jgi:GTPase Era involved in 16S rRNA processing
MGAGEAGGMGRVNVLVVGVSGVGKSTLINAVLGEALAEVGQGRPVTSAVTELARAGCPLTLLDTRGLEMARPAEAEAAIWALVRAREADADPGRRVHVAWLCISEGSRRVQEAESRLSSSLARHMPVLAVITKARSDQGFSEIVRRLVPDAREVVRVRAIAEIDDDGIALGARGVGELVARTVLRSAEAALRRGHGAALQGASGLAPGGTGCARVGGIREGDGP